MSSTSRYCSKRRTSWPRKTHRVFTFLSMISMTVNYGPDLAGNLREGCCLA